MAIPAPARTQKSLETEKIIWVASVRSDGQRPHLVPVWFAWHGEKLFLCVQPDSIKARNIRNRPGVALALEDGTRPVICEGTAAALPAPWPEAVCTVFQQKYEWDIRTGKEYTQLLEITPEKWLSW